MPITQIKSLIELIEKSQSYRQMSHQQKMFEITLINMYHLGGNGRYAITEHELKNIQGLSRLDLFNSIKEAEFKGLIEDCSTHDQREWLLTLNGTMYVEALLDEIKEK